MSYHSYGRLKFCYQLLAFFSILGMGAFTIATVITSSVLYGWVTALFIVLAIGSIKRAEMYQTKMDNWRYKHYLDKNE